LALAWRKCPKETTLVHDDRKDPGLVSGQEALLVVLRRRRRALRGEPDPNPGLQTAQRLEVGARGLVPGSRRRAIAEIDTPRRSPSRRGVVGPVESVRRLVGPRSVQLAVIVVGMMSGGLVNIAPKLRSVEQQYAHVVVAASETRKSSSNKLARRSLRRNSGSMRVPSGPGRRKRCSEVDRQQSERMNVARGSDWIRRLST